MRSRLFFIIFIIFFFSFFFLLGKMKNGTIPFFSVFGKQKTGQSREKRDSWQVCMYDQGYVKIQKLENRDILLQPCRSLNLNKTNFNKINLNKKYVISKFTNLPTWTV